ncbi:MAG: hypothetical protein LC109_09320 [Bacteroidia bacterium]|nr:hypothetical protein [Bacteroidia bacterium]MCO5254743.1 hypothetical protein [Bacteroidota bacterium]MCZ2130452.1 hypothetical protein [Bacteroidia bacterium]
MLHSHFKTAVLLLVITSCATDDIQAQRNITIEPFTAFSWSANKSYISNQVIIEHGSTTLKETGIGFGSGNEYGVLLKRTFDSSYLTLNLGFSGLVGKRQQISYIEDKDSAQISYQMMDAYQLCALLGFGFKRELTKRFDFHTDLMLIIPFVSRLKGELISNRKDFSEQTSILYKTNFSPGFNIRTGLSYQITKNIALRGDISYTFMSMSYKSSEIRRYTSSSNQYLAERYPTVSDRETIYFKDLSKVKNDPVINPTGFNSAQPSESISEQLPFSRMGINISLILDLNLTKDK